MPAAAAGNKDASGDVAMGEVDGVGIELPKDADQETKDLWQQHHELEKKVQQLRGEMGAKAAKRREANLASPEAVVKVAAEAQAATTNAAEAEGGSSLARSSFMERVRSQSRSPAASPVCLPTFRVGVLSLRPSLCITVMTITLCHSLSRIYFGEGFTLPLRDHLASL